MTATLKPLGRKAYGSIGHIVGSRLGPGDHHVHEGQSTICTENAGGRTVWVQAKLDGSCVAAAKLDSGEVVALSRAGYLARTSPHRQHHLWADWVDAHRDRFDEVLAPGERLVGEWLAQAHGTRYDLSGREPFVAFDLMTGDIRRPYVALVAMVGEHFATPDTMQGPIGPRDAMGLLDDYGAEFAEGVVYRVESKGRVEFLAKWVRPDKVDGSYLLDGQEIWNWRPEHAGHPVDWDGGSFCVETGCGWPASHQRPGGVADGRIVFELVCCQHATDRKEKQDG